MYGKKRFYFVFFGCKGVIITNAKHLKELFQLNEFIIFMLCKIKENRKYLTVSFYLWFRSIIFYLRLNPSSLGWLYSHIFIINDSLNALHHPVLHYFLGKKSEGGFSRYIILDWKMFKASIWCWYGEKYLDIYSSTDGWKGEWHKFVLYIFFGEW